MSNEELYQQAKTVFTDLVDLPDSERHSRLAQLAEQEPALAKEVSSLLEYHTVQSLVVPPPAPKIRTRSTLSTTYQTQTWNWLLSPLRTTLIALPFVVLALLAAGWIQHRSYQTTHSTVTEYLNQTVGACRLELRAWESETLQTAMLWGQDAEVKSVVKSLVTLANQHSAGTATLHHELQQVDCGDILRDRLEFLTRSKSIEYTVWDRRLNMLCSWKQNEAPEILATNVTPTGASVLTDVMNGKPRLYLPSIGQLTATSGEHKDSETLLASLVPVYDEDNTTILATLVVRGFGLEEEYTSLLKSWNSDTESEVYLVNERGGMLTQSRYGDALQELHLAYSSAGRVGSFLLLRDPGCRLLQGEHPESDSSTWNPTLPANQINTGNNGFNADGYRNYVGSQVVGAWRAVPELEIGLVFEWDHEAAYAVPNLINRGMLGIIGLLTMSVLAVAASYAFSDSNRRKLRDISEVGPYQVQELLGEGGMGRVYLAEHALLCRQSAVKVLTNGNEDLSVIGRFEREVQLASQLTHPNTIAIYDFGRNKDGLFYYAMEYINGAHLGQLVEFGGPLEPGRCIYILRQLCRALLEAHQAGVVHRDIKPQNIMVCNRGGEPDFVKLFDYGLVKSFAPGVGHYSSQTKIVVGTPRFMAPERLNSPWLADPRVDVYSVGALAYFLLTGQLPPLVTMDDGHDYQQTGVETLDLPASVLDFGELLSVCLAFEPSTRPSNMSSLMRELDTLSQLHPWNREDSAAWWEKHEAKLLLMVKNKRKNLNSQSDSGNVRQL